MAAMAASRKRPCILTACHHPRQPPKYRDALQNQPIAIMSKSALVAEQ